MIETILALSAAILAACALIALAVTIPLVRVMRRTASRVDAVLARYEQDLGPLLVQARQTLLEMQRGAARVEAVTGRLDRAILVLDQVSRLLSGVRVTVGRTVTPPVATAAAVIEGVRQAVQYLFGSRVSDGKREEDWEGGRDYNG